MRFFKLSIFTFLVCICTIAYAQPQLTEEDTYFSGEHISSVSVGSQGVWVIKGSDSLGLGKLDYNGTSTDYTSQIQSINNRPLTNLVGKYRNEALLSTKEDLFWFKNGVLTKMDTVAAGITGNRILGMEGTEGYTRILTNSNIFTSYDNQRYSLNPNFSTAYYYPRHLLGTATIAIEQGPRCSPGPLTYTASFQTTSSAYKSEFPYDPSHRLHDFVFGGETWALMTYIAHSKGLFIQPFNCTAPRIAFQDTATYCLEKLNGYILIGTEKGLFYCQPYTYSPIYALPLSIGEAKIYSMTYESEKEILWIGTDKGLVKLKYSLDKPIEDFILAPEWVDKIGGKGEDEIHGVASDKEGNILVTGGFRGESKFGDTTFIAYNSEDYYLAKYTNAGMLKWVRTASSKGPAGFDMNEFGSSVCTDQDDNVYTYGYLNIYSPNSADSSSISFGNSEEYIRGPKCFLAKYGKEGNLIWTKFFFFSGTSERAILKADASGNVYLMQKMSGWNEFGLPEGTVIYKFDNNGNRVWVKSYPGATSMDVDKTGNIFLAGKFDYSLTVGNVSLNSQQQYTFFVLLLDRNGNALRGNYFNSTEWSNGHIGSISDITHDGSGNVYVNGFRNGALKFDNVIVENPMVNSHFFLIKFNPFGKMIWVKRFGGPISWTGDAHLSTDELGFSVGHGTYMGDLFFGNKVITTEDNKRRSFYFKVDPNGNLIWLKDAPAFSGGYMPDISNTFTLDHKNNVIGILSTDQHLKINGTEYLNSGGPDVFVFKIYDSLNTSNYNIVRGKIYNDKNDNHAFDGTDEGINGVIVKVQPGEIYAQSDSAGDYALYLKKGTHTLEQVIPEEKGILISQNFPLNKGAYSLNLAGTNADTSGFDFADKAILSPYLEVDISAIRRRRCFRGTTTVQYCNNGFVIATDVKLKVEFPEYVIPIASSTPWTTQTGKVITYTVGDVPAGVCGFITITDSVQCGDESILGLTQCVKATITPSNSVVPPNPDWDNSDLELNAKCKDNGYINLVLKNKGTGNMSDSTQFRIYLDTTIVYKKNTRIIAGDSVSLNIPANGRSLRAEADQTAFHPSKQPATVTMEGCLGVGLSIISKGFTNQFSPNDEEEELEISCMEIIGSMDPNDKQVIPKGITENYFIEEDSELEYILRFMNKGTDTAFTVRIEDTLSHHLDISTFKPGVTSHPCIWKISGEVNPVLTCTFNNINLPDSITNEMASHGFAKFTIRHKPTILGQQIKNKAYIYFDYNSPVITNEVLSTIGLPPLPEKRINIQQCRFIGPVANDTSYVHLCGLNETEVSIVKNDTVYSVWEIKQGNGQITPSASATKISNLLLGNNTFQLNNKYCDITWSNVIQAERYDIPPAPSSQEVYYCEGTNLDSLTISGNNVEWFETSDLSVKIHEGNKFLPLHGSSGEWYVKQTVNECGSEAGTIKVIYTLFPESPETSSHIFCLRDKEKFMDASGSNITWYYDTIAYVKAGAGNRFATQDLSSGDSLVLFATQTINGCESKGAAASIYVKPFNIEEVYIPNLFSRTGTSYFHLPAFITNDCVGPFENVQIFDLSGARIFFSEDQNFRWLPLDVNGKLFLYHIKFSDQVYKGKIFVQE